MSKRPPFRERLINALMWRKRAYESYFAIKDDKTEVDNQAQNAYLSLVKVLFDFQMKAGSVEDAEETRKSAMETLRREYGIER